MQIVRLPRARALAAGLAAVLALPAAAQAAGWTQPRPLDLASSDPPLQFPSLGFGAGAETLAVTQPDGDAGSSVTVFSQALGAERVQQLRLTSSPGGAIADGRVAVAPNGAAALSWMEIGGELDTPVRFMAAYRRPDGTWEPPVLVAQDDRFSPFNGLLPPRAQVAIGDDGTAVVLAEHAEADGPGEFQPDGRVDVAVHPPGGGWSAPERLSPADVSSAAAGVGVSAAGEATVAFVERTDEGGSSLPFDDHHRSVARTWRPAAGGWSGPEELLGAADGISARVSVATAPGGETVVTSSRFAGALQGLWISRRSAGAAAFGAPQRVTDRSAELFDAALTAEGDVVALANAMGSDVSSLDVVAARAGRDGAPAVHVVRGNSGDLGAGDVASGLAGGRVALAWSALNGPARANVEGAVWEAGAPAPTPAHRLAESDTAEGVTAVADREGSAAVAFATAQGGRIAAFDASGPRVLSASVPATATAGQPVQLTARFADRWSPLAGEPTWDFGDGRSATGTTVTHAFAAAGDRMVTVRAADALGNETVERFPIRVATGPTPPPPPPTRRGGGARRGRPRVTLAAPRCPRRLSKASCRRWRGGVAAWRVVRGTAAGGVARVQVRVVRRGARPLVRRAVVKRGRWAVRLPRLAAGRATLRVRGLDARRRPVGRAVEKRLRLRLRPLAPRR